MKAPEPTVLGLSRSFGFGDRLGLAGPGHLAALGKHPFAPILAQQSIRELDRTQRTAEEVMEAAEQAILQAKFNQPWGADADHLKTREDVVRMTQAGYRFFTIDPSAHVQNAADTMNEAELTREIEAQQTDGVYHGETLEALYGGKAFPLDDHELTFDREALLRAGVKYGRAIAHVETMAGHIAAANAERAYEIEVSVDETDSPTDALEHLFFALELRRRGITVVSLAPRFIGAFEKGIDYKGDLAAFEAALKEHVAIARAYGPYKISVHSGSDKFSIYPVIGRLCGDLLHVKTAGTSYLEALRVVARQEPKLFREIVEYSLGRFGEDKASYHISVTDEDAAAYQLDNYTTLEKPFLDEDHGRQVLHVTFGSVLTRGKSADGRSFREVILETLRTHDDLHRDVLQQHLGKHLELLLAG